MIRSSLQRNQIHDTEQIDSRLTFCSPRNNMIYLLRQRELMSIHNLFVSASIGKRGNPMISSQVTHKSYSEQEVSSVMSEIFIRINASSGNVQFLPTNRVQCTLNTIGRVFRENYRNRYSYGVHVSSTYGIQAINQRRGHRFRKLR